MNAFDMNLSSDEDDARVPPPSAMPPLSVAAAEGEPDVELDPAQWEVPLEGAHTQPQGEGSDTESDSEEEEVVGLAAQPAAHDEGAAQPEELEGIAGANTAGSEEDDEEDE